MDEEKEIVYSKILDLIYNVVDFDYFDEAKYLSTFQIKDPTYEYNYRIFFYGYSLITNNFWFYEGICIGDNRLIISKWFIEKWRVAKCDKKDFQLGSLKKLIEVAQKGLKIINLPNYKEEYDNV